jgi:hypothetical protein
VPLAATAPLEAALPLAAPLEAVLPLAAPLPAIVPLAAPLPLPLEAAPLALASPELVASLMGLVASLGAASPVEEAGLPLGLGPPLVGSLAPAPLEPGLPEPLPLASSWPPELDKPLENGAFALPLPPDSAAGCSPRVSPLAQPVPAAQVSERRTAASRHCILVRRRMKLLASTPSLLHTRRDRVKP